MRTQEKPSAYFDCRRAVVAAAACTAVAAGAVVPGADGTGQSLVFPYYTAQSVEGSAYNTYLSVVNHGTDAKALRVRLRNGQDSASAAEFNLFLAPGDVWTAAVVPSGTAAALITTDRSCTSPAFTSGAGGASFPANSVRGGIEVLEMATLQGASAATVNHDAQGNPVDCTPVRDNAVLDVGPPTGGLSGSFTLINVAKGFDFTMAAEALDQLASQPYYRPASDPYPGFNAAEIAPVSVVTADGFIYRSVWNRPVDAVSATLMRSRWSGEYFREPGTNSKTDMVMSFPMRSYYFPTSTSPQAPYPTQCGSGFPGNFSVTGTYYDREQRKGEFNDGKTMSVYTCPHVAVFALRSASNADSNVLGPGLQMPEQFLPDSFVNGWAQLRLSLEAGRELVSLPSSTRTNVLTGATTSGSHSFAGLPMLGFVVRTLENGTLTCGAATCQGNYGGIYPLSYGRTITAP